MAGLARLTAKGYLDSLSWLPEGLREIIAVHTLNAGTAPRRTPALFATMPAVMATEGVWGPEGRPYGPAAAAARDRAPGRAAVVAAGGGWVPEGGPYELVVALARLAEASGVEIRTGEPVERVEQGRVF